MIVPDTGALRHRLVLETLSETVEDDGGRTTVWTGSDELWAGITGLGARERIEDNRLVTENRCLITTRFRGDVKSGMRFRKASRVFLIETVRDPDETGRFLVCETVEGGR